MEVADLAQAKRVAALASAMEWEGIEIWRDWIDTCAKDAVGVGGNGGMREMADVGSGEIVEVGGRKIPVQGEGNGRAVVCWRGCALS